MYIIHIWNLLHATGRLKHKRGSATKGEYVNSQVSAARPEKKKIWSAASYSFTIMQLVVSQEL
jgi:hypothetical protein